MNRETPSFITPLTITFPMDGQDVTVTANSTGQLGSMLEVLKPMLPELQSLPAETIERLFSGDGPNTTDVLLLLDLLADHHELPQRMVAIAMGWPYEKVAGLLPDRFGYLFALVMQVNADFFGRALPALLGAAVKFRALQPELPTTPGPGSSTS